MDVLDEYDFIIGLESIIQLEATYYLASHILTIEPRSIPLYPYKNIQILPKTSTMIQLIGDLPCDFSSGTAIIRVKPINETFSYITLEAEFINQITSFLVSDTSDKTIHLLSKTPIAFLDLRSIGYFNPPSATQTLAHQLPVYTYVTHFNSLFNVSIDRYLPDSEPTMCTMDPYPWLDSSDP